MTSRALDRRISELKESYRVLNVNFPCSFHAQVPYLLKTSLPGVFAVSATSAEACLKRVASAVGDGSIAVVFVHQALRE
ncbi:MAG: hypothetical protein J2P31_09030 [Blastocatellia bacterium]|nr:hypothetical protein [Blastocatellia bacterium]